MKFEMCKQWRVYDGSLFKAARISVCSHSCFVVSVVCSDFQLILPSNTRDLVILLRNTRSALHHSSVRESVSNLFNCVDNAFVSLLFHFNPLHSTLIYFILVQNLVRFDSALTSIFASSNRTLACIAYYYYYYYYYIIRQYV